MNTAQQRILNVIEAKIRAKGFDCAAQYDYSNTGTIYIYSEDDSVRAFAEVTFDFQGNTYTLRLTVNGKRIPSQHSRNDYFDFYQSYSEGSRFWELLDANLTDKP